MNYIDIIRTYKPQKGFIDLSVKPSNLNKRLYAKILNVQMILMEQQKRIEYLKLPYNKIEFEAVKQMSADLQRIILQYWEIK